RSDIVNAGSEETGYSKCRVGGRPDIVNAGSGRPDIDAGSGETRYSECRVGEIRYSECRVRGDQI
ncbi:unnamed protein product, partial [Staurois parvus]